MSEDQGNRIEFREVGAPDGPLPLPEVPPVASPTPPGEGGRRPIGAPGRGAIPAGVPPMIGPPVGLPPPGSVPGVTVGGPPLVRDAGPPMQPSTPAFTAASVPTPTAPASGASSEVMNAALAPEAEKRIRVVVDKMIDLAEERLKKSGESTAKGILEQFAAQGGKRFVERMSADIATLTFAALKPQKMRRLVAICAAFFVAVGFGIGSFITVVAMHPRSAPSAAAALLAEPHMAQSFGTLARNNDAAVIMRIAVCDPALGLVRRRAQDGRVLCAGGANARFGWSMRP